MGLVMIVQTPMKSVLPVKKVTPHSVKYVIMGTMSMETCANVN